MENAFGQPQNVVVLGGSSDIARAITRKLCAARTHTVILAGRNQDLLDTAAAEAQEYGATKTDTVIFDAEDVANAKRTVSEAFEKVGDQVDLVVVAIGLLADQLAIEDDAEAVTSMVMVNFAWPVVALAEVRRRLVAQGSGRILVISSVASVRVRRSMYLYSGTKAGLDRLCEGLADSLRGTGVSLQLLRPGVVRSRMTQNQRNKVPFTTGVNEVAENAVRGLASGDLVIWSPPALRYVFALLRHLPAPLWRRVMDGPLVR